MDTADQPMTHAPSDQDHETGSDAHLSPTEMRRIQTRFDSLVAALTTDGSGMPRSGAALRAYTDGVRSSLDCLAYGEVVEELAVAGGSLAPGTILANSYLVRALIGIGGMAEVYQVRHRDLRADFAIKILKPERARDPLVVDLFAAEAKVMMALRHDGIVRAYALLRHVDGRPFLVLDLARGPTLAQAMKDGALDFDELRSVGFRLASSLDALHVNGMAHGDLSAENVVLISGAEGAALLDLGLARSTVSQTLSFAGKWSIAAPEQIEGAPPSPAADMFSLGLVLAGAARGARLEMGHDLESARACRRKAVDLRGLPRPLAVLVGRLLDPMPAKRPSASEVMRFFSSRESSWRAALRHALGHLPISRAGRLQLPGSKSA